MTYPFPDGLPILSQNPPDTIRTTNQVWQVAMDNMGWQFHPRMMVHYMYMMQDQYKILAIHFDAALTCHLIQILNLMIIYPKEDILT